MPINIHHLANYVLHVLKDAYSDNQFLKGQQILQELKIFTGDRYEPHEVMDAVEVLTRKNEVETILKSTYVPIPWRWDGARITSKGVDTITTNPDAYLGSGAHSTRSTVQTINILGDVHGDVTQANQSEIIKNIAVTKGFDRAKDILMNESGLLSQDRDQAIEHLKIIENESNKISPNKSSVNRSWKWLKNNTPRSVLSVLEKIVAGLLLRSV